MTELKNTKTNNPDQLKARLEKVVVNSGIGRLSSQPNFSDKILPEVVKEFASITSQRPATQAAKKSIAGFKLRAGTVVGLKTTLRGKRMMQFLNRLSKVVLPRIRDFKGIALKNIDKNGNLSFGIKEHTNFPEIASEQTRHDFGLEVTVVPRVKSREEAVKLYRAVGLPLKKS